MAKEWQKILDDFSSGKSSTSPSTSSSQKTSSNNAQDILDNFSGSTSRKKQYDDAIAPVASRVITRAQKKKEEEEKKKKRKWYEKGLFEDGYDLGDITKTILGVKDDTASLKDLTVNSVKRGYYNSRYGEESFKDMNGEKNEKEVYEKILAGEDYQFSPGNGFAGAVSGAMELIGQQARQFTHPRTLTATGVAAGAALVAGQAGPQVALPEEIISVPAAATAAFTAGSAASNLEIEAGHAYNEMLEAGISEETARKVAWGVGGVNAGLELLQVDELMDAYKATKASGATKTFTKKIVDELVDRGVDVAKETVQEVAQEGVTIAGTQAASKLEKGEYAYNAEEVKDRLKDTAKSSALSFGLMNAPAAAKNTVSIASEQHKANSLTTNEQKVVDKVAADRIAEAEKDGTKLSSSEKKKITESVVSEMEKGYLSIDDIESALGGETYEEYKRVSEWEDGLQKEFDKLHAMKRGEMTGEQLDREAHLKEQLRNVKATSSRDALKSKLSEDVFGLVSGDRLIESYNERTRRGQAFEADLTKYDTKQQATIQKAIDSGILNNTNRTHEFVDIISKISADKGVLFDFTNNKKLKESGFAIEGKQVNGFVTKDGISINIDSPKAWQSTVGHEVTHVLEGTDLYTELQNTLFEYAKTKGEYDSRMQTLTELYKDIQDADLNAELTADLVGEYLFTDENFIKNLSTQNRNVFQKIYDEIKYLCKVATGSKEAKELERVKRTFDKAYKEAGNGLSDTKYSISSEGKKLTKEQQEYFKDSKARDENGNLKLVYHSSPTAGFTVFDGAEGKGNYKYGDYGDGITFFTDNKAMADSYSPSDEKVDTRKLNNLVEAQEWLVSIGQEFLEVRDENGSYDLYDNIEEEVLREFDSEEELLRELKRAVQEELGDINAGGQYEGYVDLKNPLVVDAEGRPWNRVTDEFSQEVYEKYQSLSTDEKSALTELTEWEDFSTFRNEILQAARNAENGGNYEENQVDYYSNLLASAYNTLKDKDGNVDFFNLFDVASDNFSDETVREKSVIQLSTNDYVRRALEAGTYDGVIIKNVIDYGGNAHATLDSPPGNDYIVFNSNQFKAADNLKPTDDADIRYSLSKEGEQFGKTGQFATPATELRYEAPTAEESQVVAPVAENATTQPETQLTEENSTLTAEDMSALFPNNAVPVQEELDQLIYERDQLYSALEIAVDRGSAAEVGKLAEEYEAINSKIKELESEDSDRVGSLIDAPPEMDAPIYMNSENYDPWADASVYDIDRSTRSYSDRNPGARRFLEEAALGFGYDVNNSTHGERWYNDQLYYESGGEQGFGGTSRHTTSDIAELKDAYGYTWDELQKAADDVVKGEVRSVAAKRVELLCHKRLMEGYTDVDGRRYEPNQEYISFLNETFANEQRAGSFDSLLESADQYAPTVENSTPALKQATPDTMDAPVFESKDKNAVKGQTTMFAPEKPKTSGRVARVLTKESKTKEKSVIGMKAVSAFVDKGMVFENLSLDSGNQEVQAKWNSALPANTEKKAQYFMENGADGVKPLKDIIKDIKKTGKEEAFTDYMYHVHNVDRMSLEDRFGLENKAVFGDTITAEISTKKVQQYEKANPEFKTIAESVYAYNKHLRGLLVENGVISQETADLWEKEYPHYVPVRRVDQDGKNITVPLDTNKTGVNAPVKRATGGNSDIEPLFNTMALRTEQIFSAIARNSFGIELKNTLGSTIDTQKNATDVDEAINLIEDQESNLLKPGTLYSNPTFTVFENGERVEFEITEDMYDALKPAGKLLGHRSDKITKVSEWRRNMLTTWNPVFALWRNPVKDLQDVMINSQHAAKTYAHLITPTKDNVIYQIATHGKWAAEYESNGGKGSTYFDGKNKEFEVEDNILKKTIGFPLRALENAGEFIEEIPRLAEYIASRKEGRSVDRSMLDAARVTTNFAAGGDVTKFANAHGFTFLNASVQGASQHVRNFREATRQDGMKGFVKTLAKYTLAGIPGIILNNMIWDDDEEYEELSDYVKQNYYVVAKTEEGKFIRIPKGRTAAVMNNALEQMQHLITGDGEADFGTFYELFMNNIAPNNPIENNILAPIRQVKNNRAWYGEDLVPSRLQDLPAAEQFDESTDSLSKFIGEKTGTSPYKWNYLIDQYSGGLGDMILPTMTPEAESGDNTLVGNLLAPWKKEMTTDSTLNNKNPGNFYDLKDELDVVANGKNATEEDKMKSLYLDSVGWDMGDLYAQKREIQNSNLPDDQKYAKVREIQAQINELANNALDKYNNVSIDGSYSEVGDRRFNYDADKDKWYEIQAKNSDGSDNWYYVQEQLSHDKLGMNYSDFWNGKEPPKDFAGKTYYAEYNGKRYDYSEYNGQWYEIEGEYLEKEQNAIKRYGITPEDYWNNTDLYYHADRYFDDNYATNDREVIANAVFGGKRFAPYAAELSQIRGEDNDGDGKTDSGSKKKKILNYINGLDLDYGEKIIMYRTLYSSKADKRAYNQDIIDYLNERDDISYGQMKSVLEELGFKVDDEGYIKW